MQKLTTFYSQHKTKIITAGVPQGTPFMSYPVQFNGLDSNGLSTGVVIQEFNP